VLPPLERQRDQRYTAPAPELNDGVKPTGKQFNGFQINVSQAMYDSGAAVF
jgi:hypothetical protein